MDKKIRICLFALSSLSSIGLCSIGDSIGLTLPAYGQGVQNDLTAIELSGKLEEGRGNLIQLTDSSGNKKTVMLPNESQPINYKGTATLEWIQQGLFARFSADLDAKFQPKGPLTEIEIFVPMMGRTRNEEEMRKNVPGTWPIVPKNNPADPKKTPANKNEKPTESKRYDVVGQIMAGDQESLLIVAGNQSLKCAVNENTKINIHLQSLELAKPGDIVKVSGLYSPKNPDQVMAQSILITGSKPLGVDEKMKDVDKNAKKSTKGSKPSTKSTKKDPTKPGK